MSEVRELRGADVDAVLADLAPADRVEMDALGLTNQDAKRLFEGLIFSRAFVAPDGEVVAVSGFRLQCSDLAAYSNMLSTPRWRDAVFTISRTARRQFRQLIEEYGCERIVTYSHESKTNAHRWYRTIGLSPTNEPGPAPWFLTYQLRGADLCA